MASKLQKCAFVIGILIELLLFVPQTSESYEAPLPPTVKDMVEYYAGQYGVDTNLAFYIVEHESGYDKTVVGDMNIKCPVGPYKGKPVMARGIWQITRCYFPEITDEQAFDPDWSTQFAMEKLSQGKETCKMLWTTCRWYYN